MSFGPIDLLDKFKGTWATLKDDERTIICTGKSAAFVKKKALEMGYNNPILTCLVENQPKTGHKLLNKKRVQINLPKQRLYPYFV